MISSIPYRITEFILTILCLIQFLKLFIVGFKFSYSFGGLSCIIVI